MLFQVLDPKTGKFFQEVSNSRKIKNSFLRQEPFALKNQFVEQWNQSSFVLKVQHLEWIIGLRWIFETQLIYQRNFSTENDYHITTMNWDLFIPHNYGGLLDDIKKLSTVSRLVLEKGAAYQFDLSLVELAFSFPVMEKKTDKLNILSSSRLSITGLPIIRTSP